MNSVSDDINKKQQFLSVMLGKTYGGSTATSTLAKTSFQQLIEKNRKEKLDQYETILKNQSKGQIIFYGPPGTGKTYIAKMLANKITNAPKIDGWLPSTHRKIVQFHTSYSYEDFVQGIKPVKIGDELAYEVKPGIFQKICLPLYNKLTRTTWAKAALFVLYNAGKPMHYVDITVKTIELGLNPTDYTDNWIPSQEDPNPSPHKSLLHDMWTEWIQKKKKNKEDESIFRQVGGTGSPIWELNEESPDYEDAIKNLPSKTLNKDPKVLIIDEINRGNLSKIFGELIYGLEYRGEEIDLQYKEFDTTSPYGILKIPPKEQLMVIGTMNTADRSIVLFDTALRRRFSFIALFPDYDLLAQSLDIDKAFDETEFRTKLTVAQDDKTKNKILSVLALEKINSALTNNPSIGREKQIGHTFLLDLQDDSDLFVKIWKREILPLLEEYYFESPDELEKMFDKKLFETKDGIKEFNEKSLRDALDEYTKPPS